MGSAPRTAAVSVALTALLLSRVARSQPTPAPPSASAQTASEATPATEAPAPPGPAPAPATAAAPAGEAEVSLEPTADVIVGDHPPPTNIVYFQYGVALAAEAVSAAGPICDTPGVPCILGPGGGITVRAGWRGAGPIYLGGAYEVTKQDPRKLYRLALLQQARVEGRYYWMTARITEPYAVLGLGVAGYGNEWGVDTWGPGGSLGVGVEYQVTQRTVIGMAIAYRALYFSRFTDTSGAERDPGIAQLVGLDVVLEQRDPSSVEKKPSQARR